MARLPPRLVPPRNRVSAPQQRAKMVARAPAPFSAPPQPSAPAPFPTTTPPEAPMANARLQTYTLFTRENEALLVHQAAPGWVVVKLELEDAGPVSVGTSADLFPVLSGKGRLLPTDRERSFRMTLGDKLYVAADTRNRIAVTIEPMPEANS